MKLLNFVQNFQDIDEGLIIFIEDLNNPNSDIILEYPPESQSGSIFKEGKEYHYLLEVFLAVEFISDWTNSLTTKPSNEEVAQRLFEYAINDA